MRLLFAGFRLPTEFERLLLAQGFTIDALKPAEKYKPPAKQYDLVAVCLRNQGSLKEVERLRAEFPSAWMALLVPTKAFGSPKMHNALLAMKGVDALWYEAVWPVSFWTSLKQMLEHQNSRAELTQLREQYDLLSATSLRLVTQMEKDVDLASNIQRALLPRVSPEIPGISITVKHVPAAGVGGDYYDIFEFGDRMRFGLLIADSKTHGMAAALLATLIRIRLDELKERFPDSQSLVAHIHREVEHLHARDLAPLSLLYGVLDRSSLTFRFTSAGTLKPLLWRMGNQVKISIAPNPPLGERAPFEFKESELALRPGDLLVFFTDGLEGLTQADFPSAEAAIVHLLRQKHLSPDPHEVRNDLMGLVDRHKSASKLTEDLTLIQLWVNEKALYVANSK